MTRDQFKVAAIAKGWSPDRFGHLQHRSSSGKQYRLKLGKLAWRLEQRITPEPGPYYTPPPSWVNRRSEYYSKTTEDVAAHKADQSLRLVPGLPEPRPAP